MSALLSPPPAGDHDEVDEGSIKSSTPVSKATPQKSPAASPSTAAASAPAPKKAPLRWSSAAVLLMPGVKNSAELAELSLREREQLYAYNCSRATGQAPLAQRAATRSAAGRS